MKIKMLSFVLVCLSFASCVKRNDDGSYTFSVSRASLGDYVYVDASNCVHVDKQCENISNNGQGVAFVKTDEFKEAYRTDLLDSNRYVHPNAELIFSTLSDASYQSCTFCSKCVSDADYEELTGSNERK
jgi:hypothetical protein